MHAAALSKPRLLILALMLLAALAAAYGVAHALLPFIHHATAMHYHGRPHLAAMHLHGRHP